MAAAGLTKEDIRPMKVTRVQIQDIRCFTDADLELSPGINVVVGPNNNGKTTLLNCISILQQPCYIVDHYKRIGIAHGSVRIWADSFVVPGINAIINNYYTQTDYGGLIQGCKETTVISNVNGFQNTEPHNFIIPYQSKRKVGGYSEGIDSSELNQVPGNLSNLYAKIDRISNPEFQPAYDEYITACDTILGFRVSTVSSEKGKKAAYFIKNDQNIPIDRMGEGISNLLGLIVDLCRVENKLFIIEEPENDIHPRALKSLLDLVVKKSDRNQFIVTTHSNIVVRHLGSAKDAKLFNIDMKFVDKIPTSSVNLVDTPEKRRWVLEDLGYELFDYGLWDYWIFFEESSAERIFRDFLIPWFAPKLQHRVRTFSARSVNEVSLKFEDFNRLFVFLHLQETYRNRVWVVVDGGAMESRVIKELADKYEPSGWDREHFRQFLKHDFEEYYPAHFSNEVKMAIGEQDKKKKAELKKNLLDKVVEFSTNNQDIAKQEFQASAVELIDFLNMVKKE